jgi:glycosyltransferase involved in cell wall biosynthesis
LASANKISFVIPVYNEAESIQKLHEEVVIVAKRQNYDFEIIIVDDGSTDNTEKVLKNLSPLTYIQLRRNFGQTAAMDCGIKEASGELIVTMDGDGQNDPADIPKLIHYLKDNDLDIVSGWRKNRKDPLMKKFSSRMANLLRAIILNDGLHDSGCSLKVYKAECFKGISLYGEIHRFIPALLKVKGFKIGEIIVNHRPRQTGHTKYNWTRGVKGILDMINVWFWHKYAVRPLHLLGGLGALSFSLGLLVAAIGIIFYLFNIALLRFFLPQLSALLLISGMQIFLFGIVADMLSKNYFSASPDTPYSIKEVVKK